VVEDLAASQSEAPAVAPPAAIHPTLVPLGPYLSSLSATAPRRCHPRWEPDALVAPVRICGGASGATLLAAVVLLGDQLSVPGQERLGRDDGRYFTKHTPAQFLRPDS
jgi:hypothetical protein